MDDKTLVERARSDWDNLRVSKLWWAQTYGPDLFSTIEAQATHIKTLEAALRDIKNAVLQGGMTDIVAWQRLVIACQTTAKQALEGEQHVD